MKGWCIVPRLVIVILIGGCVAVRMAPSPHSNLEAGRLLPCPGPPNCVCSQDPDPARHIAPLAFDGAPNPALARLKTVILAQPRIQIVDEQAGYLRVEFRSRIFRFVDDVEFLLDEPNRVIHVRSASRVGHSDLGVNRRRVEKLRREFAAIAAVGRPHRP